jgi:tetratricopeptide (TPR) repeat protein
MINSDWMKDDWKEFVKTIKHRPEYEKHINLGLDFREKGKYDEAIREFQKAVMLYPSEAMVYNLMGNVYMIQKKYKEALECCELFVYKAQSKYKSSVGFTLQGIVALRKEVSKK